MQPRLAVVEHIVSHGRAWMAPMCDPARNRGPGFGGRGVIVLAGVGAGKVLMWEYIDGRSWSGAVAAEMYSGAMLHVLKKQYPGRRHFNVFGGQRSDWL